MTKIAAIFMVVKLYQLFIWREFRMNCIGSSHFYEISNCHLTDMDL